MNKEAGTLKLLSEIHHEYGYSIKSMAGKTSSGIHQGYLFHSAKYLWDLVRGYCLLRASEPQISRLLIRPAIEVTFRIKSVQTDPSLLFHIASHEKDEERAMIRDDPDSVDAAEQQWVEFRTKYASLHPEHDLKPRKISPQTLAKASALEPLYQTHYRLYCKHTHATLRSVTGGFKELSFADNPTMAVCVLSGIEVIQSIGGIAPNYAALSEQLHGIFP